ncbi:septum formation initiator family protein [bacterium]|nr:septum formation initiator family protein [bacterium]
MDKNKNSNKGKYKSIKRQKPSSKVTNIETVRKKAKAKSEKQKRKSNVYYSFLTIVLLFCLAQIGFSAILNISKNISYRAKVVQIKQIRDEAEKKNKKLKREIKEFSSVDSLEAIARNNLKMAGEDEVLILINDKENSEEQQNIKKKKKGIFHNDSNGQ